MYEDFHVTDRWSGEELHCRWKGTLVAIATRHADAVDVRFDVNGRPMWIALPLDAWGQHKQRSGKVITDQLAAQIAGRYLKQFIRGRLRLPPRNLHHDRPRGPGAPRRRSSRSQSPGRNAHPARHRLRDSRPAVNLQHIEVLLPVRNFMLSS